ncbi:MAG: hypothetical protein ACREOE_21720, partial [Gemmatimonadales bacterium]
MIGFPAKRILALGVGLGLALASVGSTVASTGSGHSAREVMMPTRGAAHGGGARPTKSKNLTFGGGNPGVVTGGDKVYLVAWGSGWGTSGSNDPSGEVALLTSFFQHVGGSNWNKSVTQYCEGVARGTVTCGTSGTHAVSPSGDLNGGSGVWYDTTNAAPAHPTQTQLAAEAQRAALHFGQTTAAANVTQQYVILTATGNNASGAWSSYCAWHSSTSS